MGLVVAKERQGTGFGNKNKNKMHKFIFNEYRA